MLQKVHLKTVKLRKMALYSHSFLYLLNDRKTPLCLIENANSCQKNNDKTKDSWGTRVSWESFGAWLAFWSIGYFLRTANLNHGGTWECGGTQTASEGGIAKPLNFNSTKGHIERKPKAKKYDTLPARLLV